MRRYATFFIIACMTLGVLFFLFTKDHTKHDAPAEIIPPAEADAGDAGALDAGAADAAVAMADAAPAKPAEKPLRITTLGWELAAAGAVLSPADGGAPAAPVPAFELAPELSEGDVEARLARGGSDPQGADIAIVPLPSFIASYERLRALDPRMFLVVGYSHGREEVRSTSAGALAKAPPAGDDVKLVALGTGGDALGRAAGSESATLLGLFALDLIGVPASKVHLVPPGSDAAKTAPFSALVRGAADERKVAFSTADASRLVPIVAVAPKAVLDAREPLVRELARAWIDGLARGTADVPTLARRLSSKEALPLAASVAGAPEALTLVERLGQIQNVALDRESAAMAKLEPLATRSWQLARGGGLTPNAAPEPLPVDPRITKAIAPPATPDPLPTMPEGDAGLAFGSVASGSVAIALYRATENDADKTATQIMFLSTVFERATFRIAAKGGEKNAHAIATLAYGKGVALQRLSLAKADPGLSASVEVLSPP